MKNNFFVRVFIMSSQTSGKPAICELIKKILERYNFSFSCTLIDDSDNESFLDKTVDNDTKTDCIILDKGIYSSLKEKIINSFKGSEIICLPSLSGNELPINGNIKQISEPLRLSELEKVILEIYNRKFSN